MTHLQARWKTHCCLCDASFQTDRNPDGSKLHVHYLSSIPKPDYKIIFDIFNGKSIYISTYKKRKNMFTPDRQMKEILIKPERRICCRHFLPHPGIVRFNAGNYPGLAEFLSSSSSSKRKEPMDRELADKDSMPATDESRPSHQPRALRRGAQQMMSDLREENTKHQKTIERLEQRISLLEEQQVPSQGIVIVLDTPQKQVPWFLTRNVDLQLRLFDELEKELNLIKADIRCS